LPDHHLQYIVENAADRVLLIDPSLLGEIESAYDADAFANIERPDASEEEFDDGYLRTGDVVTVDEDGYVHIVDRAKDVIKSGGELISSLELENALMGHEDVAEATVIGVPHERWQKRPVAFVVPGDDAEEGALATVLAPMVESEYPRWWTPDEFVFIEQVPKTATGKFDKKTLREEYADRAAALAAGQAPDDATPGRD